MLRLLFAGALIGGAVLVSEPGFAGSLDTLTSPHGDMPTSTLMFPPGPGSDEIDAGCLACHSADHVLNQPSLTRENWQEIVNKMINAYKAPIDPDMAAKIVDYLVRTKGKA
jgi:hypothetical protein